MYIFHPPPLRKLNFSDSQGNPRDDFVRVNILGQNNAFHRILYKNIEKPFLKKMYTFKMYLISFYELFNMLIIILNQMLWVIIFTRISR